MGIWQSLFKSTSPSGETTFDIVETHLAMADHRYQVAIRKGKAELYAENLFQAAKKPLDLTFSRFLLLQEDPPKPHFAPSAKEAIRWFQGRNLPKDGYGHIWWGDKFIFKCATCQARRVAALEDYRRGAYDRGDEYPPRPLHRRLAGDRSRNRVNRQGNPDQKNGRVYHRPHHYLAPGAQSIPVPQMR